MKNKFSFGFTLAEIIVVLTLLGVVAAITIPSALNNTKEKRKKVKIQKAFNTYDKALNNIIIENGLKSDNAIDNWNDENCENVKKYFKISENGNTSCQFKTPDGLWWDFTEIRNAIVSTDKEKLSSEYAEDKEDYDAFYFEAEYRSDIGALMINDMTYAEQTKTYQYKKSVRKTFCYLQNICKETRQNYLLADLKLRYNCISSSTKRCVALDNSDGTTVGYYGYNEGDFYNYTEYTIQIFNDEKAVGSMICSYNATQCKLQKFDGKITFIFKANSNELESCNYNTELRSYKNGDKKFDSKCEQVYISFLKDNDITDPFNIYNFQKEIDEKRSNK